MYSANDRVQTEYKKAKNHIKKCYISAENKNATYIPDKKNLENLPSCIDSIISKYGALLSSIRIENAPIKTSYIEGEVVDLTGLTVLAVYDNGATRDITDSIKCTPANGDIIKLTDTSLQVEFEEGNMLVATEQKLNVAKYVRVLQYIEVTDPPKKTIYLAGNVLDLAGITVTATYGRGEKVDVTSHCVFSPADKTNLTVEDNKISITYTENGITKSTQIAITVELSIRKLLDITITTPPTKTNYYTSEYFNTDGLKVVATFEDGSSEEVTEYCSFTPAYFERADISEVIVSYSENNITKSKAIPVTITENVIENIAVVEMPKTEYFVGQSFDSEGLKVVANYTSGMQIDITSECAFSSSEALTIDDEIITISYLNFTTSLAIKVSNVEMVSIAVTKLPSKIIYYEGENVVADGIEVTANFNNGSTMVLSEGINYSPQTVTVNDSAITVTYQGLQTTYKITVLEPVINKIEITTPPTKTSYFKGDLIDVTGLKVTGTYTDGTTEDITAKCSFEPSSNLTVDDTAIIAKYNDLIATTPITVTSFAPVSISITQNPTQTVYLKGTNLNLNGMIAKITFNDSTTTQLINGEGVTVSKTEDLQTTDTSISVSYTLNGITVSTSFAITVVAASENLSDNSWEVIKMVSEAGVASQVWNIGDTKQDVINGNTYTFRIIGFDHDELVTPLANGRTKAGITFEATGATEKQVIYSKSQAVEWANTAMFTKLNTMSTQISSELATCIKEVKKNTGSSNGLTTDVHKIFILSIRELLETSTSSSFAKTNAGEGSIYEYYRSGNSIGNGSNTRWTRSFTDFISGTGGRYIGVDKSGSIMTYVQTASYPIAPAFCI